MVKQTVDLGASPDSGDGDPLRTAFQKTQDNIDELYSVYYVTDTSIANHGDPNVDGSVAKALADAHAAGGGTVQLGPGVFAFHNTILTIEENVCLKGVGRQATVLRKTGFFDAIQILGPFSGIEGLTLDMSTTATSDGVFIRAGNVSIRDAAFAGGLSEAWAIRIESTNVVYLNNIRMGGTAAVFYANGIVFENQNLIPYNFGDSKLSKIDITLAADNTTGLAFLSPTTIPSRINNILCSQVEIVGNGSTGGCTGVHLRNAARIVLLTVDLEELTTAVYEESVGGLILSSNNAYIGVFVFGTPNSYVSSGTVGNRTFVACDNFIPDNLSDSDAMFPTAVWLNNGGARIWEDSQSLQFDDGDSQNGLKVSIDSNQPVIRPSLTAANSKISIGNASTQGVECLPGVVLPVQNVTVASPAEGMLCYLRAGLEGPNEGLYHYRSGAWVFIG